MDFWKKLKKEKLLLSVMTMAIVDLLVFAIFIVFPFMDYNYKDKVPDSTTETVVPSTETKLEEESTEVIEKDKENDFSGAISDKYNSQGVDGYNSNKGDGGLAAKDTTHASTEEDDILIDDNLTTTEDVDVTTEISDSEEDTNDSTEGTEDGSTVSTEDSQEENTEETTEETKEEIVEETSKDTSESSAIEEVETDV